MEKPYIFCHMLTSIDGKITGPYMDIPESAPAGEVFYKLAFGENPYYKHRGWLSGRVTTDDNFTHYQKPTLGQSVAPVPQGDFIAQPNAPMYYVSVDPGGRLGWQSSTVTYEDTSAHVLEVLTGRASTAYKAFLRGLGISYITAGNSTLDCALAMHKVKTLFGVDTLMLGGGGVLNWSFIQAGMCDELSVVVAPAADGVAGMPALFETRGGHAPGKPVGFALENAQVMDGGSVWLRYKVKQKEAYNG